MKHSLYAALIYLTATPVTYGLEDLKVLSSGSEFEFKPAEILKTHNDFDTRAYEISSDVALWNETELPPKPDKGDKDLQIDAQIYDFIDKADGALNIIKDVWGKLPNGNSPKEIVTFAAEMSKYVAILVPQFAVVGAVLGFIAGFLPGGGGGDPQEPQTDPMITYIDAKFAAVEAKLKEILDEFDNLILHGCRKDWEEDIAKYIGSFQHNLRMMSNHANTQKDRDSGKDKLVQLCDHPSDSPDQLINKWKDQITQNGECFKKAVEDSADRVLYFRRAYVAMYMSWTVRALEYKGLCDGLGSYASVQDSSTLTQYFEQMTAKFNEVEASMYPIGDGKMILRWRDLLKNKYSDCLNRHGDSECVLAALQGDFYPDYKYATVGYSKNLNGNYAFCSGKTNENYDSFSVGVDRSKGGVFIWFRNPKDRTELTPSLRSKWTADHYGCDICDAYTEVCHSFLTFWCDPWSCKQRDCSSAESLRNHFEIRNKDGGYGMYAERGAVILPQDGAKIPENNDDIIEVFNSGYGPYKVIGLAGAWPGLTNEDEEKCGTTADCKGGFCCSDTEDYCTSTANGGCMENRWGPDDSVSSLKHHVHNEPSPDGADVQSSPPACSPTGESIVKMLRTKAKSAEGTRFEGLKPVIQKVLL